MHLVINKSWFLLLAKVIPFFVQLVCAARFVVEKIPVLCLYCLLRRNFRSL